MIHAELITLFRSLSGDSVEPYLMTDADLTLRIAEAEREAAERALFLRTDSTHNVAVVSGTSVYAISDLIIFIDRAKLSSEAYPLTKITRGELDFNINTWETETGTPTHYIQEGAKITLYPIPDANFTLQIDGSRRPSASMETPSQYHEALVNWCLYRFYSIFDEASTDQVKAGLNEMEFTRVFGPKRTALSDSVKRNTSGHSSFYQHPFN